MGVNFQSIFLHLLKEIDFVKTRAPVYRFADYGSAKMTAAALLFDDFLSTYILDIRK